jgi:hypothetical protein
MELQSDISIAPKIIEVTELAKKIRASLVSVVGKRDAARVQELLTRVERFSSVLDSLVTLIVLEDRDLVSPQVNLQISLSLDATLPTLNGLAKIINTLMFNGRIRDLRWAISEADMKQFDQRLEQHANLLQTFVLVLTTAQLASRSHP